MGREAPLTLSSVLFSASWTTTDREIELAVAAFAGGGHAALDALVRGGFDVTSSLLAPRRRDTLRHTLAILRRARRGARP